MAEVHDDHADGVADRLRAAGFRVDVVRATEPLGKRVRGGKVEKIPYILVVGDGERPGSDFAPADEDVANDTVGVNRRGEDKPERDVSVDDFVTRLAAEVAERV